jgi:hypothetical protein
MVLVDPDIPAVPTTHVKYGNTYHIHLENFPANSDVHVELLKYKVKKTYINQHGCCCCLWSI